jgi:hypothetical protein
VRRSCSRVCHTKGRVGRYIGPAIAIEAEWDVARGERGVVGTEWNVPAMKWDDRWFGWNELEPTRKSPSTRQNDSGLESHDFFSSVSSNTPQ